MPLPRYERLAADKRKRLLQAALREFADKGFEEASLNAILLEAGFGKSSYYYYFADKEDLFATVLEDCFLALEGELPPPIVDTSSADAFWAGVLTNQRRWFDHLRHKPDVLELFRTMIDRRRMPSARFEQTSQHFRKYLRQLIDTGREHGFVRGDRDADLLLAIVEGADSALDGAFAEQVDGMTIEEAAPLSEDHMWLAHDTMRRLLEPRKKS